MAFKYWRITLLTILASSLYFAPFGIESDVLNNPEDLIQTFIGNVFRPRYNAQFSAVGGSFLWSMLVALFPIGQLIGSLCASYLADKYGRRGTLVYVCSPLAILSGLIMLLPRFINVPELLWPGRLLTGIRVGISSTVVATYVMESTPDRVRGAIGSIVELSASVGAALGYFLTMPYTLGTAQLWPFAVSTGIFVGALGIGTAWLLKESPKYLLITKKNAIEASRSLAYFHGDVVDVAQSVEYIMHQESDSILRSEDDVGTSYWALLKKHKRCMLLSLCIGMQPAACGYLAVGGYSTALLTQAGLSEDTADNYSLLMAVFEIVGSVVAIYIMEELPRRKVTMFCGITLCATNLTLIIILMADFSFAVPNHILLHTAGILLSCLSGLSTLGPFPQTTIIPNEMAPQAVRSLASTISYSSMSVGYIITQVSFWPIYTLIGGLAFAPFVIWSIALTAVLWRYMPETNPHFANRTNTQLRRIRWRRGSLDSCMTPLTPHSRSYGTTGPPSASSFDAYERRHRYFNVDIPTSLDYYRVL